MCAIPSDWPQSSLLAVKGGVAESKHSHILRCGWVLAPCLYQPGLQGIQEEQYLSLEGFHNPQGRVRRAAEVEILNDLVKSPQLVTGRGSRNKQAALSILLPGNKQPLSPSMPGTVSAVQPQIYNTGFKCNGKFQMHGLGTGTLSSFIC